jgi:hypothetical protein
MRINLCPMNLVDKWNTKPEAITMEKHRTSLLNQYNNTSTIRVNKPEERDLLWYCNQLDNLPPFETSLMQNSQPPTFQK